MKLSHISSFLYNLHNLAQYPEYFLNLIYQYSVLSNLQKQCPINPQILIDLVSLLQHPKFVNVYCLPISDEFSIVDFLAKNPHSPIASTNLSNFR